MEGADYKDYSATIGTTMNSLAGLEAQAKLVEKVINESSAAILEQANVLGIQGDTVEMVKGQLDAYIENERQLESNSRWKSAERNRHQDNKNSAIDLQTTIDEYDQYLSLLTENIKPRIESMRSEIAADLNNSIATLVTDALNPYRFSDIPLHILTVIKQSLLAMDWGDATANEIQAKAEEMASTYAEKFEQAYNVATIIATAGLNDTTNSLVSAMEESLEKEFKGTDQEYLIDLI